MKIDQFEEFRAQIAASAAAVTDIAQPLVASMQPVLDAQRVLADALAPTIHQVEQAQTIVTAVLQPLIANVTELHRQLAPVFNQLAEAFEHLPPRQRRALEVLGKDGWYLDPGLDFKRLFEIADLFEAESHDDARVILCEHFDQRAEAIGVEVAARFPARSRAVMAAIAAHRRGEYVLSIPVLLAQADGVCTELIGVQLYSRRDGKPQIAAHLRLKDRTPIMASLLHPLSLTMPVSAGQKERLEAQYGDLLNRHSVLHGESTDYDTRINSCRALSLLVYVSWVLEKVAKAAQNRDR